MTYVVPNYFKQNDYKNFIQIDNLYCLKYITKFKSDFVKVRTTMHSLAVLLQGSKIIHINKKDININSGNITLLTQNNYYMSQRIINHKKYKSFLIYFDDKFIQEFIEKYKIPLNTNTTLELFTIDFQKDLSLKTCIDQFRHFLDNNFDEHLQKIKIEEIFLHIYRINKNSLTAFFKEIINTSKDRTNFILESNIDILQSIHDMCNITNLSQNQLRRYIKSRHNTTPKIWLDTKRVHKASFLLINTQNTISEIASSCGYATVSWFISQFKKYTSTTPKDFRYKK